MINKKFLLILILLLFSFSVKASLFGSRVYPSTYILNGGNGTNNITLGYILTNNQSQNAYWDYNNDTVTTYVDSLISPYYSDEIYINLVDTDNFTFNEGKLNETIDLKLANQGNQDWGGYSIINITDVNATNGNFSNNLFIGDVLSFGSNSIYSIEYTDSIKHEYNDFPFIHNTGNDNVFIGENSGSYTLTVAEADDNTGIGHDTLKSLTTGRANIAIGSGAGDSITEGNNNVFIGVSNGGAVTTANSNTGVGTAVMPVLSTGANNLGFGSTSLNDIQTGNDNIGIGVNALSKLVNDNGNVAIGYIAGRRITDGYNTIIGSKAGSTATASRKNTLIGYSAGKVITTGEGNVVIGYAAAISQITTEDNILWIENTAGSTPLIYGEFDNDLVKIGGDLYLEADDRKLILGADEDNSITHDGTNMIFDVNATTPFTGIGYFTGGISVESITDRSSYWNKSLGNSLDYVQDSDSIKNELTGRFDDTLLNDFDKSTYLITDKDRPVNESFECEQWDIETEKVIKSICYRIIYPFTKEETGRSISAVIGKHEQNIYDLNELIVEQQTEINMLKSGLCAKDNTYSWC